MALSIEEAIQEIGGAATRAAAMQGMAAVDINVRWESNRSYFALYLTYTNERLPFDRDQWWELLSRVRDELERLGYSIKGLRDVVDDDARTHMELLLSPCSQDNLVP